MEERTLVHAVEEEYELHIDGQHYENFYVIDEQTIDGVTYFLLESCLEGEDAPHILAKRNPVFFILEYIGITWNSIEDTVRNEDWF